MAVINKEQLHADLVHAGEYGSVSSLVKKYNANLAAGDVLHIARIPAHTQLQDLQLFNGAAGGSSAVKVGYVPVDSANGAGDDAFFIASTSTVSAARKRADTVKAPVTLPYEVDIVITATAAFSAAVDLTVHALYEWRGK